MPVTAGVVEVLARRILHRCGAAVVGSIAVVLLHAAAAPAQAQYTESPSGHEAVRGDDDADKVDIVDVIHRVFRRENTGEPAPSQGVRLLLVPEFGAAPRAGFQAGAGALIEFPAGNSSDPNRFSSINTSVTYSTQKQVNASVTPFIYGRGWKLEGQNSFMSKTADDVVLGTSSEAAGQLVDFNTIRIADTFYVRTLPRLFVGVGVVYKSQDQIVASGGTVGALSAFQSYSLSHGFNLDRQTSAGGAVAIQFDNRDNRNDAVHGWLIAADLRQYVDGIAGGDSRWREAFAEIRTYRALTADKRHKLAFWTYGDFVTKGVAPYLSLPMSAGDPEERSDRGYAQGRFRGEQMVYGEVEYRGLVTRNGLVGVVSFVNVATLSSSETGEKLFHSAAVGGGAGLRVLFSKRSRANICLDVGVGRSGSHGVYFGLNDAF
jgi:hypothetical protein